MFGKHGYCGFVPIANGKMEILATFPQLQDKINMIRRYEGWYYTKAVLYVTIIISFRNWTKVRENFVIIYEGCGYLIILVT